MLDTEYENPVDNKKYQYLHLSSAKNWRQAIVHLSSLHFSVLFGISQGETGTNFWESLREAEEEEDPQQYGMTKSYNSCNWKDCS